MNAIGKKVYNPNTTAQDMSTDGWSRGFKVVQTLVGTASMDVVITRAEILLQRQKLDAWYKETTSSWKDLH